MPDRTAHMPAQEAPQPHPPASSSLGLVPLMGSADSAGSDSFTCRGQRQRQ